MGVHLKIAAGRSFVLKVDLKFKFWVDVDKALWVIFCIHECPAHEQAVTKNISTDYNNQKWDKSHPVFLVQNILLHVLNQGVRGQEVKKRGGPSFKEGQPIIG